MSDHYVIDCESGETASVPLTDEELAAQAAAAQAAQAAEQIQVVEQTNETTLRSQADAALATNRAFLALGSPNNAQTLAQVKALTRQNIGIIRLLLRKLDGTD